MLGSKSMDWSRRLLWYVKIDRDREKELIFLAARCAKTCSLTMDRCLCLVTDLFSPVTCTEVRKHGYTMARPLSRRGRGVARNLCRGNNGLSWPDYAERIDGRVPRGIGDAGRCQKQLQKPQNERVLPLLYPNILFRKAYSF